MSVMTRILHGNNARAQLAAQVGLADTTITLASGQGTRFPSPGPNQIGKMTLENSTSGNFEIVTYTNKTGDIFSGVVRAQEGTTAIVHPVANTRVGNRVTAGTLSQFFQSPGGDGLIVSAAGVNVGTQNEINFIEGVGISLTVTNNTGSGRVDVTVSAGTVTSPFVISDIDPIFELEDTNAAANNQRWQQNANAGVYTVSAVSDDGLTSSPAISISRSALTISIVNLIGTSVQANGSIIWTQANVGARILALSTIVGSVDPANDYLILYDASTTSAVKVLPNQVGEVPAARTINTQHSLTGGGDLSADRTLNLVNDTASPGNSMLYGTNGSGVRGWYAQPSGAVGANPTATIGLTAVNGAAGTFLRSDGAPALSQAIAPTWTAQHTFSLLVSGLTGGVVLSSANPGIIFIETDATATNQVWDLGAGVEQFRLRLKSDDGTTTASVMLVDRTGMTIDSIALTSTALTWNGNPISTAVGANPTASVGLAAVNGAAATFMRSDAAPVLSQAITPVWTGTHEFLNNVKIGSISFTGRQIGETAARVQIEGNNNGTSSFSIVRNNASSGGGILTLGHSRGSDPGGITIVANNDAIGQIDFAASDGVDIQCVGARIVAQIDGTPGSNDMPTRLVLATTPAGAATPVERLRISNDGAWGLAGATYGSAGQVLTSNGSGAAPTWQAGGGSPGGANTQIQYNNSGAFAGDADLTWDSSTNILAIAGSVDITAGRILTKPTSITVAASPQNLDLSAGNEFHLTLQTNVTLTFSNPPSTGKTYTVTIFLLQDGTGSRIVTWPASVHWSDGITPVLTTTANRLDAVVLTTIDGGTTYYGGQTMANIVP